MPKWNRHEFSPEQMAGLVSLWPSGIPIRVMAERMECEPYHITNYVMQHRDRFPRRRPARSELPSAASWANSEVRRLIDLMNERGLSVEALAEKAGVHPLTIRFWMRGAYKPTPALLEFCFEALETTNAEDGGRDA